MEPILNKKRKKRLKLTAETFNLSLKKSSAIFFQLNLL